MKLSIKQKKFVELCARDKIDIDYTYCGRGMFGEPCPCIRVDTLSDVSFNPYTYNVDNMGKGFVIYCP